MWYVYILKSEKTKYRYIGSTNNVRRRFIEHNEGLCKASKAYKPFRLAAYFAVMNKEKAIRLERYLKTASGTAFLNKRIFK